MCTPRSPGAPHGRRCLLEKESSTKLCGLHVCGRDCRESDALIAHADAWMDLAEVLWLAQREGVADCVEEAISLYEQKENVAAAGRARAWLGALSERA